MRTGVPHAADPQRYKPTSYICVISYLNKTGVRSFCSLALNKHPHLTRAFITSAHGLSGIIVPIFFFFFTHTFSGSHKVQN